MGAKRIVGYLPTLRYVCNRVSFEALSLKMIRKFSQLLKIPADLLIQEYPLRNRLA